MHKFILFLMIIFLTTQLVTGQHVVKEYKKTDYIDKVDSLRSKYGTNKFYPKKFELAILLALSHYPELTDLHITFELNKGFIPLISRPTITSMLGKKKKWHYKIFISDDNQFTYSEVLLKNIPFNAQVGIIGHELAHTVSYLHKSFTDMLSIAVNYVLKKYRSTFEKDTDKRCIQHGLGWQLYDYAIYTRTLPAMTPNQVEWIDQFYMNHHSIYNYMQESGLYELNSVELNDKK